MTYEPRTILIAIDPGASGGMAVWNGEEVTAMPMPGVEAEIAEAIADAAELDYMRSIRCRSHNAVCYLEKVGGFVAGNKAPGSAMFNFGRNFGFILGALAAFEIPTVLVTPQAWQKALGLGHRDKDTDKAAWKNKLKAEAWRLYPALKPTLKTADALLILEFARRTCHE